MNARNLSRELRRSRARRDRLANEIAFLCSEGRMPCSELLVDWSIASIRYDRLKESLRPRECGVPLGEGNQPAAPLRRVSSPVDRDAGRGPESGISSNNTPTQTQP